MAFSKIVGFEVTPLMPSSAIRLRELAGFEQFPADVVEPDRLAQLVNGEQRVAHDVALPGRGSAASYPAMRSPNVVVW